MANNLNPVDSSWIESISYLKAPDGSTFLALFLAPRQPQNSPRALLYAGVPPWMVGLLCAALGGRSVGRAYNRLLKGKGYQEQTVEGWQVRELKRIMEKGV